MAYYVYVSSQEDDKISIFAMDGGSGKLDSQGEVNVSGGPAPLAADPQRSFFFAAGLESGRLASFRVDSNTGGLEPLETYAVGGRPMWVLAISLPG